MANQFKDFCPTDTGTNLTDLGDYTADTDRISGQKPGVAKSALNNRALRQANFITSQFAQFLGDKTGADINDDANTTRLLAQINAAILPLPPVVTRYTATGAATHNITYQFFIVSGSATAGATYTNNAVTFTVVETVASGVRIKMKGNGAPAVSGTLTKASGTGDATLTFYAYRKPLTLRVIAVGAGGGGGGSNGSAGTDGTDTTFGANLTAGKGIKGLSLGGGPGTGGVNVVTPTTGLQVVHDAKGGAGQFPGRAVSGGSATCSGMGGTNPMGGTSASPNTGAGGKGGANNTVSSSTSEYGGDGGGAGGYLEVLLSDAALLSTFSLSVGTKGNGGAGGGVGMNNGEAGSDGLVVVEEEYQ